MSAPINYTQMTYDVSSHRYIPTIKGIEKALSITLSMQHQLFEEEKDIPVWLDEKSQEVYDYIYSEIPIDNVDTVEFLLAYESKYHKLLFDAFAEQAQYDRLSGASLLKSQHGVNIERAKSSFLADIRGRVAIAPAAAKKIQRTGLLTNKSLPYTVSEEFYRVEY